MSCKNKCHLKANRHNDDYTLGYCDGIEQGRADRDKEIAESNVFFSNRLIEDIVHEARACERERIVKELEKKYNEHQGQWEKYKDSHDFKGMSDYKDAIEIVRGGENEKDSI